MNWKTALKSWHWSIWGFWSLSAEWSFRTYLFSLTSCCQLWRNPIVLMICEKMKLLNLGINQSEDSDLYQRNDLVLGSCFCYGSQFVCQNSDEMGPVMFRWKSRFILNWSICYWIGAILQPSSYLHSVQATKIILERLLPFAWEIKCKKTTSNDARYGQICGARITQGKNCQTLPFTRLQKSLIIQNWALINTNKKM